METLYVLKKYNNYFNRIVKKETSIQGYLNKSEAYNVIENANFAINDGVNTQHVNNFPIGTMPFEGNYLLVTKNNQIVSRWFILENTWTREGQYIMTLRRDLIIDFYDEFANSGFYCERGLPENGYETWATGRPTYTYDDPAIFFKEPIEFNEIKKASIRLTDNFDCQWIVFFTTPRLEGAPQWEGEKPGFSDVLRLGYYTGEVVNSIDLKAGRIQSADVPYAIWCLPYPRYNTQMAFRITNEGALVSNISVDRGGVMALTNAIIEQLGAALYDVQILPYCPCPMIFERDDTNPNTTIYSVEAYDVAGYSTGAIGNIAFSVVEGQVAFGSALGIGALPATDSFINAIVTPDDGVLKAKIESQCTKLRIIDQFGTSIAEWNPLTIGAIDTLKISMTLKPYQSTIGLIPAYTPGALYLLDETTLEGKERRGCISTSNFSLPRTSDAWIQYTQNNVNFNNIFNRQIETQERQYEIQNQLADFSGALGVFSSALGGANRGAGDYSFLGGGYGAGANIGSKILGGVVAAGASTEGFNIDRAARYEQTELALSLAKDTHAMNLANIKARPDTLTKVGTFDELSDTCFILEIYTSTDAEKQWFKDYLRYHGCTINHISTFDTEANKIKNQPSGDKYVTSFVRGTLLRCNLEDAHEATELTNELMKGVYIDL